MLNPVVLLLNKALYEFVKDDFQNHNFAPVFIDKKNCNQDTIAQKIRILSYLMWKNIKILITYYT